LKSLKVLAP